MTDRDRLIELIYDVLDARPDTIADYLISNGVILPPCKVGDTVYVIDYTRCGKRMFKCFVEEITRNFYGTYYYLDWGSNNPRFTACNEASFGKTVFLTKEEAEKALEERTGKNE